MSFLYVKCQKKSYSKYCINHNHLLQMDYLDRYHNYRLGHHLHFPYNHYHNLRIHNNNRKPHPYQSLLTQTIFCVFLRSVFLMNQQPYFPSYSSSIWSISFRLFAILSIAAIAFISSREKLSTFNPRKANVLYSSNKSFFVHSYKLHNLSI